MARIAVVTADTLAARMAGPAIRARAVARALAVEHEVVLASTGPAELVEEAFRVRSVDDRGLRGLVDWCDVFVFQGWILAGRQFITSSDKVLVADVYDPMHLEQLEQGHDAEGPDGRRLAVHNAAAVINEQLLRGDFLLCASAKQRDLWLGALASLGRVNPCTYDADPALADLLAVVPFGISDDPPLRTRPAIKGVVPGIGPQDKVVLWGGGIYNWFDPLTLIHAIAGLRTRVPEVRLVFMGLRHPNPEIPEMRMAVAAQRLADELGLTGTHVFFNEGWVPYDERQNHLLDADVGVTTHLQHIETEYSFRTRVLDYLWAGLPIVATEGDSLADLVAAAGLGVTVPAGDPAALEEALAAVLCDHELAARCRANVAEVVPSLRWSVVLDPLVRFCRAPHRAPDLVDPDQMALLSHGVASGVVQNGGFMADVHLAVTYVREGGVPLLVRKARSRVAHLRRQRQKVSAP